MFTNSPIRSPLRVLLMLVLAGLLIAFLWSVSAPTQPVTLNFLTYTTNGFARIALFEITSQTDEAFEWSLHADGRIPDHRVAVTELIEADGQMRHIGSGGPLNLFPHDSLSFGTDELSPGKKTWVRIKPYPRTHVDRVRESLAGWLYRFGWHRGAFWIKAGIRVDGPVLPADKTG